METKRQLQLMCQSSSSDGTEYEPPFLIFAVGIYDLMPDVIIKDVINQLNKLVGRERYLREEFGSLISNLTFATMWPPSMVARGASPHDYQAQQLASIVMRFYNKWILVINNYNQTEIVRFCRGFQCDNGKYKLKLSYVEKDGISPSGVACEHLVRALERGIPRIKDFWNAPNKRDGNERMLMRESWNAITQAHRIYLQALSGQDNSKLAVYVPIKKPSSASRPSTAKRAGKASFSAQKKQFKAASSTPSGLDRIRGGLGIPSSRRPQTDTMKAVTEMAQSCPSGVKEKARRLVEKFQWQDSTIVKQRHAEDQALFAEFRKHFGAHFGEDNMRQNTSLNTQYPSDPEALFREAESGSQQFYDSGDTGQRSAPAQWSRCKDTQI